MQTVARMFVFVWLLASCGKSPSRSEPAQPGKRDEGSIEDAQNVDAVPVGNPPIRALLDRMDPPQPPPPPLARKHRRGDCKTAYAPRPKRDPNPMCRVEGGTFMFGGGTYLVDNADGQREVHVPAVATTVRSFYIDQFEVTAAQAAAFLNAHGNVCEDGLDSLARKKQDPHGAIPCLWIEPRDAGIESKNGLFLARSGQQHWPAGTFTWEGALRYCAWAGKQVPSGAQWEYAARHDPKPKRDLLYPWGDTWISHVVACNDRRCDPRPAGPEPPGVDPLPVGTFDGTKARADGSSPWGAHDMAGGASELVFECSNPDETCEVGRRCSCKVLTTSSFGAPNLTRLRVDHRIDETLIGTGLTGVRCVMPVE